MVIDESDFARLGQDYDAAGAVSLGPVGDATARLMPQRDLVDFATDWLATHGAPTPRPDEAA